MSGNKDFGDVSMLELFRIEVEGQAKILSEVLLELENDPTSADSLEQLMRSSHSIKGAARMVDVDVAVRVAHVMEDCFVVAQEGKITINGDDIDTLLKGVDILVEISELSSDTSPDWFSENAANVESIVNDVTNIINQTSLLKNSTSGQVPVTEAGDETKGVEITDVNDSGVITVDNMMLDLFKYDAEIHISAIIAGLKITNLDAGESLPESKEIIGNLKQSAYSLKGGAALIELSSVVQLARVMEDCFSAVKERNIKLSQQNIDSLIQCIDIIKEITNNLKSGNPTWESDNTNRERLVNTISSLTSSLGQNFDFDELTPTTEPSAPVIDQNETQAPAQEKQTATVSNKKERKPEKKRSEPADTAVRISSSSLNRLMGLAGESIVESRRLRPYADSLLTLKRRQTELFAK